MVDWLIRLIGCAAIAVGFAAAYLSGRQDERSQKHDCQKDENPDFPVKMEHTHGERRG